MVDVHAPVTSGCRRAWPSLLAPRKLSGTHVMNTAWAQSTPRAGASPARAIHFTLRVQWLPPDVNCGQDEQHARAGQATENHRDHRAPLSHPACLCALCVLCGKPHGPRGTAHTTFLQAPPLAVIPTGGPGLRCRVACPSASGPPAADGHVLAMQGGVRRPMATLCVAMPPNGFTGPPWPSSRPEGRRPGAEGPV